MKIRSKINYSYIIIFIIIAGIIAAGMGLYTTYLVKNNIYSYLHSGSSARAEHVRTFLQDQQKTALILAAASVYLDFIKEPVSSKQYPVIREKIIRRFASTLEADPNLIEVDIIGLDGKILVSSDPNEDGGDESMDDYFIEGLKGTFIKDVYYLDDGTLSHAVSAPIKDSTGTVLGVSLLRYKPDLFYSIVENENGLGDTEENFLINKDKFLITPSRFLNKDYILKQKIDTENANDCYDPQEMAYVKDNGYTGLVEKFGPQLVEALDYRNIEVIGTHAYIPETGWCLITKVDKADALYFRIPLTIINIIIIIISIILFSFTGLILSRKITSPLKDLELGTEKIKQGDLDYKVNINTKDEFATLAFAFNSMTADVKRSRAEIEKKVAEQTQDLRNKEKESEEQKKAILNILEDVEATNLVVLKEKDKLDAILHSIGDAVFVVDGDMNVILINDVAIKMTGYTRDEILNKKYKETLNFVFEETGNVNDLFITNAIKTKQVQEMSNHTVLINKDGQQIHVADSAAPLLDNDGNVFGCVVVFRDVTHAREVDKAKTEFVSLASHQLRTPLTPIRLFSEMLLSGEVGELKPQQREYVNSISESSKRMISLVNDLLNVSRLELGRLKIEPVSTDMIIFLRDVIKEVIPAGDLKGCKIILNEPSEVLPNINIDQTLLRQVIHNLLTNSIRYSGAEKDSLISVSIGRDENNYLIGVKDNGIGIPKDDQEHMFEKFYRAENAIKAEGEGSGLGLYIIKMIVESSKGRIWFESPPKGESGGTVFYVSIPLVGMTKKEGDKGMIA